MSDRPKIVLFQTQTGVLSEIKSRPSFPMSLVSAARELVADFRVTLIDQRVDERAWDRLARELEDGPVCVGITSITGSQLRYALEAGRFVKKRSPRVPVVWGGVHMTLLPGQTLREPCVDMGVRGEGEETFAALARALAGSGGLDGVAGLSFRRGEDAVHTPPREFADMDRLPPMPYPLAQGEYLFSRHGRPSMYLETSRGCPFRCAFCYNSSIRNRTWRAMSAPRTLQAVEELLAAFPQVRHLSLVDDNYFVDPERVREISRLLIARGAGLTYQVQGTHVSTVKKMSRLDLDLLRAGGCDRLDMGVESGSGRVLEDIQKGIRPEDVLEVNRRLRSHGIEPWFNFMTGFPGETEADLADTCALVRRLLRENPQAMISPLYCYTPYPGSKLCEKSERMGFRVPGSVEEWAEYGWDRARLPWINDRKARELEALYFLSIFIDRKIFEYETRWWMILAAFCYRPVARLRFRFRFYGALAEKWLVERLFEKRGSGRGAGREVPK